MYKTKKGYSLTYCLDKLRRQLRQPYFSWIVFKFDGESEAEPFRIGVFGLSDPEVPVYDWRAPIASLYYDAELGPASYRAPTGIVSGTLVAKCQYLIRDSRLRGAFDTTLPVGDDVLHGALASRSDVRMGSIVSTIQRQQNQAIRMPVRENLVVQGPAGSAKTSVATARGVGAISPTSAPLCGQHPLCVPLQAVRRLYLRGAAGTRRRQPDPVEL